eukprot:2213978-Rhodomonas_salina.1
MAEEGGEGTKGRTPRQRDVQWKRGVDNEGWVVKEAGEQGRDCEEDDGPGPVSGFTRPKPGDRRQQKAGKSRRSRKEVGN